jgi:hypothetical protein
MGCCERDYSTLALRLATEYRLLRLIEKRRGREKKPDLGKAVEERIIGRTLAELER